ncbi:preprotein translocase subunit SecE [Actinokineospora bangkokensis]|uniref:Protein translocase subunit SecE n=1 Tax=Actinokineospora bangkokensis TaxID=1193682 RepID=A0A1Q9LF51_9PSEU|nr:preprotein translocase subunit SecE [Actinokineospora bangkokensis]OLR90667.1 preprotein translocase subunit SecE [Actinokineospora bangkokensis]
MAEDQEREEGQESAPRPSTAAARRERRGANRPAARKDADPKTEKVKAVRPAGKTAAGAGADKPAADKKGRPTPNRERKAEKVGFFARIARYLREVVAELRKVIWPTRKQMATYTLVVLVFVAFMVALVSGLDLLLGKGVFWLFA